jgi:acetolactate synthase-1/2/3 large subunit
VALKVAQVLLEMLKGYEVRHVFGLPGETTLPWYDAWRGFGGIEHVLTRDERSSAFMADGYAKVAGKPGICESPSVGSTHIVPGIAESLKGANPVIAFTSDIPLHMETRNMLTGLNQSALFAGITKATFTLTHPDEAAHIVRRAFRIATTGKPGPVHVRVPMDILGREVESPNLAVQPDFAVSPGHRPVAALSAIDKAIKALEKAQKPVIVCGQGVLSSQAWGPLSALAERYGAPVGTTINGKGAFDETHPLSLGVIGARGGTRFSNGRVLSADCIFFIGCSTDSAGTDGWRIPVPGSGQVILHLDVSGEELGNNYPEALPLMGDARATLEVMLDRGRPIDSGISAARAEKNRREREAFMVSLAGCLEREGAPVSPMRFVGALQETLPDRALVVADPGISAVYASAFLKLKGPGRKWIVNFAVGALGYGMPAGIGASYAHDGPVVVLTGDGSFGFTAGELETLKRSGRDVKVVLFNNECFGWIRATSRFSGGGGRFATDFSGTDYPAVARGFGLEACRVDDSRALVPSLRDMFSRKGPFFMELPVLPEDEEVPPVPEWAEEAARLGMDCPY